MEISRLIVSGFASISVALAGCQESGNRAMEDDAGSGHEVALQQLLDRVGEAWERGDAMAYAALHTPDADLIDFRGTHAAGRTEIVALLQPLFDGPLAGTRVEARILDFRFLSPEVVLMHTEGEIVPTGGTSIQTFVVTKRGEAWSIAAFQNTRIEAEE